MAERSCLAIILAAGEGTRMRSKKPKVLHEIAGLAMVAHVAAATKAAGVDHIALVVGPDAGRVGAVLESEGVDMSVWVQSERRGTAHAVLAARTALEAGYDDILVVFADTPLITPGLLQQARRVIDPDNGRDAAGHGDIAVIGFRSDNPFGYGRLIEDKGQIIAIREERDASSAEKAITLCNGGLMAMRGVGALSLLDQIGNDNAKDEFYLTDIVALAHEQGRRVVAVEAPHEELLGVNTRAELAAAETIWQRRKRRQMMENGVTLIDPDSVHFSYDTQIASDVTVEPQVFFGRNVRVAGDAVIHAFSHIEGADIAEGVSVGPFARLRPGTVLGENAKVGNFCEIKAATIGAGTKVNHLSYIGDAVLGSAANIGAGTITCNYDGVNKYRTEIGHKAFVGSNSALVAPVRIGDGAYVASGSVVTQDVPADALAVARARQTNKPELAARIRSRAKVKRP